MRVRGNHMDKSIRAVRSQRGFSIIEALIAGLVLSFGTLALVGVQVALTRNADVAKQRTEATRLAQERMEQLRAFASNATLTGVSSYQDLITGQDTPTPSTTTAVYNTTYTRDWDIRALGADVHREISVRVSWIDRNAGAQSVRMTSVVSKTDYSLVGTIMSNIGRSGYPGVVRQRNNNVPFPAFDIGNDKSRYQWPGSTIWYVFDNNTANVEWRCTNQPTNGSTLSTTTGCTQILAYVLAGYLGSNSVNGQNQNIDTVLNNWLLNALCALTTTTNVDSSMCYIQNVITTTSTINPNCPYLVSTNTPTTAQINELRFYKCYAALIEVPLGSTAGWGGRLEFAPAPTGNQRICRYNHLLVNSSGVYSGVIESMNNENYYAFLAANGNGPDSRCPTGTTLHQQP